MQIIYNPSVAPRQLPLHKGASVSNRLFGCYAIQLNCPSEYNAYGFPYFFNTRTKTGGEIPPLRKTIKFIVGAIHESTENKRLSLIRAGECVSHASKAHRPTKPLYVILSGEKRLRFAQSKFCGLSVSEQAKSRSDSDEGIWQRVWVAFELM